MAEVEEKALFRDSNADRLKGRDYFFSARRGRVRRIERLPQAAIAAL